MLYVDAIIKFYQEEIMAMNRIQFQSGMSMTEFFQQYGDEKQCEAALEKSRWPDGYRCDRCGHAQGSRFQAKATIYW